MNIVQDGQTKDDSLGFEVTQDTNLFKLFAEGQDDDSDTPTPVEINADDTPAPTPAPKKTDKPAASADPKADELKGDDEPTIDTEALKDLLKGKKDAKDPKAGKKPADQGAPEDVTTTDDDDNEEKPVVTDTPIAVVYNDFVEKGIIDKIEDFDGTEEGLTAAMEATVANRLADAVDQSIEDAFQKNPANAEVAKQLVKFLGQGGKINDFQEAYRDHGLNADDLDAEDKTVRLKAAKTVMANYYREMGWDADRIKRTIDRAEAKGEDVLVDDAKDHFQEYQKVMKKKKDDLLTATATADKKTKDERLAFNTKLAETIDKVEEIAGYKLSNKKQRQALNDYMFKPTEEVNGKKVPKFLADRAKVQNTPEFVIAQALWMQNGMKPDVKNIATKVTSKLEQKLSDLQKGKKAQSAGGQGTENKDRSTPGLLDFDNLEVITL